MAQNEYGIDLDEQRQQLTQKNWEQNPWMTWTEARVQADRTIRSWRQ
jgi:hypothetical protein